MVVVQSRKSPLQAAKTINYLLLIVGVLLFFYLVCTAYCASRPPTPPDDTKTLPIRRSSSNGDMQGIRSMPDFRIGPFGNYRTFVTPAGEKINIPFGSENAGGKLGVIFPQGTQVEEEVDDSYHYDSYPNSFDSIIHNPLAEINVPEKEQKTIDTENPHEYRAAKFDSGDFEADKFSPMKDEGQVDEFSPMKDEGYERTLYRYKDASYALHKDTAALQDLLEDLPPKESVLGSILTPDNFVPPSAAYESLTRTSEIDESIPPRYTITFHDDMYAVVEEEESIALVPIDCKQNVPESWTTNSVYGSVDTNIYTPEEKPYRYVVIWVPGKGEESANWLSLVNILKEQGVKNLSDTKFIFPTSKKGFPMSIEKLQYITYCERGQYIPSKHIFVGGHRDGGVLAAQFFFSLQEPLGGLIATSVPSTVTIKKPGCVPGVAVYSDKPADTSATAGATATVAPTTSTETATQLRKRDIAQEKKLEEEEEKEEVTKEEREVRDTETKNLFLKFLKFMKQKLVNFKRRLFNYIANSRQWLTSKFTKTPRQKENNELVIYYNESVENRLDAPIYLGVDHSTLPQLSEGQRNVATAFKDLGFADVFPVRSSSTITGEDIRYVARFLNERCFADVTAEKEITHL